MIQMCATRTKEQKIISECYNIEQCSAFRLKRQKAIASRNQRIVGKEDLRRQNLRYLHPTVKTKDKQSPSFEAEHNATKS